jgi:LmbE family N-acetylglucosaminyl deacetylase
LRCVPLPEIRGRRTDQPDADHADEGNHVRFNRVFRAAAGLLGSTALAGAAVASSLSPATPAAVPAPAASPVAAHSTMTAESLPCARTLNVVAHEDDDLLFINPSVSEDIAAGRCVVTLFVTAGDAGRPGSYWLRREQGSMAAYAAMAGNSLTWQQDTITLAGHPITRQRLLGTRVTLLFMRLPDAHGNPARPAGTLQQLWTGSVLSMRPLGPGGAYTKQTLIKTLTATMTEYQPDRIRTLDYAGHYGDGDHADHHTVGYLTLAAQRLYHAHHTISGYRGYTVSAFPDNLDETAASLKLDYFLAYAPYDSKVCQSADVCTTNFYGPRFTHSLTTASSTR